MSSVRPADRLGEILPCYTMRFERESKHSASRLWRAITEAAELEKWMSMPEARVDLRVGGEYFVDFPTEAEGQLDGVIVRLEHERTLAYVWGVSVIEWKISPADSGCSFSFTHHGQPPGLVDHDEGIAAGWHAWLDDFDTHLDGGVPEYGKVRWAGLMPAYKERIAKLLN